MKIKLNHDLRNFKAGTVINIQVDDHGVPKDKYWRRRMQDAKTDNCIEVQVEKKQSASTESANKKRSDKA